MKYLDERIQLTVSNLPARTGDTLMLYYVENLSYGIIFVGNCFVSKSETKRTIDITDIVRNYYDFSYKYKGLNNNDLTWSVYIKYLNKDYYSDEELVLPIYRYPNRKKELETPVYGEDLTVHQVIQGVTKYNSNVMVEGRFLPRIPYIYSDKIDYALSLSCGNDDGSWNYWTGVWKNIQYALNNGGIRDNVYSFSDLWVGNSTLTNNWELLSLYDNIGFDYGDWGDIQPKVILNNALEISGTMPVKPTQFGYSVNDAVTGYDLVDITKLNEWSSVNVVDINSGVTSFETVFWNDEEMGCNYYPYYANPLGDKKVGYQYKVEESYKNDVNLISDFGLFTKEGDYWYMTNESGELDLTLVTIDENDVTIGSTNIRDGEGYTFADTLGVKTIKIVSGTNEYEGTLIDECSAGEGLEYGFTFEINSNQILVYPLKCYYNCILKLQLYEKSKLVDIPKQLLLTKKPTKPAGVSNNLSMVTADHTIRAVGSANGSYEYVNQVPFIKLTNLSIFTNLNAIVNVVLKDGTVAGKTTFDYLPATAVGNKHITIDINCPFDNIDYVDCSINAYGEENIGVVDCKLYLDKSAFGGKWIDTMQFNLQVVPALGYAALKGRTVVTTKNKVVVQNSIPVANVDECPARYYLQWRDRYYGMQMQPFNKTVTYSESITTTEFQNYKEEREYYNISVQPKWKINTSWLKTEEYPYYESIFVSPWLKLYDVKEDQVYDVILTNKEYTEKTFTNQRNKFNLQLDLELNTKQNMIL